MVGLIDAYTGKVIAVGTEGEIDNLDIDSDTDFKRTDDGIDREFNVINSYGELADSANEIGDAVRALRLMDEVSLIQAVEV